LSHNQRAVAKVPGGSLGMSISVGPGRYEETVNVFYYRAVEIIGDCSNLAAVEIAATGVGIVIQDHAIGVIRCLTITARLTAQPELNRDNGRSWT
jgi:hypothetical protein